MVGVVYRYIVGSRLGEGVFGDGEAFGYHLCCSVAVALRDLKTVGGEGFAYNVFRFGGGLRYGDLRYRDGGCDVHRACCT